MLDLKLLEDNRIDSTAKKVYLTDNTGNYDLLTTTELVVGTHLPILLGGTSPVQAVVKNLTNPTGYGTPNLAREDLAVFILGYQVSSKGVKTPLVFNPYNPLTATKWVATIPTDGWLVFKLVYTTQVNTPDLLDYSVGDFVFDSATNSLLKIVSINTVKQFLPAVPEELLVINQSKPFHQLFIGNSSLVKNHLNKRFTELVMNDDNLSNSSEIQYINKQYDKVDRLLSASIYEFVTGNRYEAARILDFLLTNNYKQL